MAEEVFDNMGNRRSYFCRCFPASFVEVAQDGERIQGAFRYFGRSYFGRKLCCRQVLSWQDCRPFGSQAGTTGAR